MVHGYHEALPGYHPDQILHDGCAECEERSRDVALTLAKLDGERFRRAWQRAAQLRTQGLPNGSHAEIQLLRVLEMVQVQMEKAEGTETVEPFDPRCGRTPAQIPTYVDLALEEGITADQYVRREEGTYNPENGHFLCDECYIAVGMPSSPAGWRCP